MKKKLSILSIVLLCVLSLTMPFAVFADTITVRLPVRVTFDEETEAKSEIRLEALQASATITDTDAVPMPEESIYEIHGDTEFYIDLAYSNPGEYQYRILQAGEQSGQWDFDPTVYVITVDVAENEDGEYAASVFAAKEDTLHKSAEILFTNSRIEEKQSFSTKEQAASVKTGDQSMVGYVCAFVNCLIIIAVCLHRRRR